jgi:hypothetical protein
MVGIEPPSQVEMSSANPLFCTKFWSNQPIKNLKS